MATQAWPWHPFSATGTNSGPSSFATKNRRRATRTCSRRSRKPGSEGAKGAKRRGGLPIPARGSGSLDRPRRPRYLRVPWKSVWKTCSKSPPTVWAGTPGRSPGAFRAPEFPDTLSYLEHRIPSLPENRAGKWPLAASHGHGIRTQRMALRSRKRLPCKRLSRKLDPKNFLPFFARLDW